MFHRIRNMFVNRGMREARLRRLRLVMALGLVILFSACSPFTDTAAPPDSTETATPTPAVALTAPEIVEKLAPSIVMVRAEFPETVLTLEGVGAGTGIVYDNNGYILTNAHVVQGAPQVEIITVGNERGGIPARVIGISTCDDLAVLKVEQTADLTPAVIGASNTLKPGEDVLAMGYPLGDQLGIDPSVTRGIVSRVDAEQGNLQGLIQTDLVMNAGSSGGPLIDMYGAVVGINTMNVFDQRRADFTSIPFAIGIDQAQTVVGQLKQGGGRNLYWLGLNMYPNFVRFAEFFNGVEDGLLVVATDGGSPATQIGVRAVDLLVALEDKPVKSMTDVCGILRTKGDGAQVKIRVLRLTEDTLQTLEGEIAIGNSDAGRSLEIISEEPLEIDQARNDGEPGGASANTLDGAAETQTLSYTFSTSTTDWYTGNRESFLTEITNGAYNMTLRVPNAALPMPLLSGHEGANMSVSADVLLQGTARAGVGGRFSLSSDSWSYYACWIDGINHYGCKVVVDDQPYSLIDPTPSEAIRPGEANRLTIVAVGDEIAFAINDITVATFTDSALTTGQPALYIENFGTEAGAAFDNVEVVIQV
jgi:S1-C subfamily serine protease